MAEFKLVIADPKSGKTVQKEVKEAQATPLVGLKLSDKVSGDALGFSGYEFEITGGSDYCGFPMRKGITGLRRKSLLIGKSVGCAGFERKLRKKTQPRKRGGFRRKKTVCPEVIHEKISQINLKIVKHGAETLYVAKAETPAAA
jgi:small subunit ribosomal protein S6e